MANEKNPLIEMMRRIRLDIFDRSNRGALNYAGDSAILRKHLDIAREMGNHLLLAQTYSALGFLEQETGYFSRAEPILLEGIAVAEQMPEETIYAALQNNLGEAYRRQGRSEDAITAYERAVQHGQQVGHQQTVIIAMTNIGLSLLALARYDEAEQAMMNVHELIKDNPWDHISVMIEMKGGLAEVALARGEFEAAWSFADEAEKLALGRSFHMLLAYIHITKAHIAEADPSRHHLANDYYRQAREGLRTHGTPILLARTLLEEARYQNRHGHLEEVERLATEARTMFAQLGLTEETELAATLLNSPAQAV